VPLAIYKSFILVSLKMDGNKSQPWKPFWPPLRATGLSCCASAVCANKGAQPYETSFADGTKVMRLDNFEDFVAELNAKKEVK